MALNINTNIGALNAAAAASSVNKTQETAMERLSTGLRINTAADDAAGVAIASRLTSEIKGINQAIRNAMDGQAMIDTAEGAHNEIVNILQRMRELSVQAANDTNGTEDRNNLQAEMNALTAEINRISEVTTWAGQQLLTGDGGNSSNGTFSLQIGSGTASQDRITATINAMSAAALGIGEGNVVVSADALTMTEVGNNTMQIAGTPRAGDVVSVSVGGTAVSYTVLTADVAGTADANRAAVATKLTAAINTAASTSFKGLTATAGSDGSVTVAQSLTFSDAAFTMAEAALDGDAGDFSVSNNVLSFDASGTLAAGDSFSFKINGETISGSLVTTDQYGESVDGLVAQIQAAVDAKTTLGGLTISVAKDGTDINITASVKTTTLLESVSANPAAATTALSVTSSSDARASITALDSAISTVNTQRANLGAISNRLDSTVSNLTNISTNLEAGRARIQDADFAAESTSLAKSQILQQASMAMLAQANASKQGVLSLLQG